MARFTKKEKRNMLTFILAILVVFILMVLIVPEISYTAAIEPDVAGGLEKFVVWFTDVKTWFTDNIYILLLVLLGVGGVVSLRLKK